MTRRIIVVAMLALSLSTMLLAACQSMEPSAVTGKPDAWRYTDDKGKVNTVLMEQGQPVR